MSWDAVLVSAVTEPSQTGQFITNRNVLAPQDQARQHRVWRERGSHAPLLIEEALTIGGFWERVSQFSLRVWSLASYHSPVDDSFTNVHICCTDRIQRL